MKRRTFLHLAAGAVALPALPHLAQAQTYPTRAVRIISGFPPGGSNDIYARFIAQWLSGHVGQQFFVENRPGAGGNLGAELAARAAPDGYTLLLADAGNARAVTLYPNLKFNFVRDFEPVASIARGMGVLVVHPSISAKTVPELIALAKASPGKLSVASSGVGSAPHVYWELFKNMTGVNMVHVPYRGATPALTDLLGGQVQVFFPTLVSVIEHIRSGRLRGLAVTAAVRAMVLPDVPTMSEFLPGYEATGWWGIDAPKGTPRDIIETLNREINIGLADSNMKARVAELGDNVFSTSPEEFAKLIAEDTDKWAKVIRAANIKAE
jgi:tripartite-type tricarboxylate transporter receptor subunit TctC